ncbi:MAG: hemolysin III family protein [Deltaproteobacteria bacterium]|nr:hemolysin III family protein [Deltaproteobacteria bacterium]MBW2535082.1 hemolysin III family protein [Deltaproteobacteria bacterium]
MGEGNEQSPYTPREEVVHASIHGVGAVLAAVASTWLVVRAHNNAVPRDVLAAAVFGATLVLLYLFSTLYHAFPWPKVKRTFRLLDHITIFYLIAGSYTPFALVTMGGREGWTLFGVIWLLALCGTIFTLLSRGRHMKIALGLYLGMGWLGVFLIKPLSELMPLSGLALLVLGGLLYSFGAIFYAWKKLPYNHAVWHLFVMAGSAAHFCCIVDSVITA